MPETKCIIHLHRPRWNVADGRLDVVRNPLDEVRTVLVLDVQHLIVDLPHRHSSSEYGGHSQIPSVSRVTGGHHVLGVEHLLRQLWNAQGPILLTSAGSQWSEAWHEEVETRKWNHVDGQLTKIGVQLIRIYVEDNFAHHLSMTISRHFCRSTKRWLPEMYLSSYPGRTASTGRNAFLAS